jgi:transposase
MREVDRFKVIQAAERLGLGVRQVERPVRRYEAAGVAGLVSGKRGRPGNHQLPAGNAQRALALIRERYPHFGPTLTCEKRRECHGIGLAVETVRTLMRAAGLWIPRKERAPRVHQPYNRRACLGELVQIVMATPTAGRRFPAQITWERLSVINCVELVGPRD